MTYVAYFAIKMVASALLSTKPLAQNSLAIIHNLFRKAAATRNRLRGGDSLHDGRKLFLYSAVTP
jgi:hypothetical protein